MTGRRWLIVVVVWATLSLSCSGDNETSPNISDSQLDVSASDAPATDAFTMPVASTLEIQEEIPATQQVDGTAESGSTVALSWFGEPIAMEIVVCSSGPEGILVEAVGDSDQVTINLRDGIPHLTWTGTHAFFGPIGLSWQGGEMVVQSSIPTSEEPVNIEGEVKCQ